MTTPNYSDAERELRRVEDSEKRRAVRRRNAEKRNLEAEIEAKRRAAIMDKILEARAILRQIYHETSDLDPEHGAVGDCLQFLAPWEVL